MVEDKTGLTSTEGLQQPKVAELEISRREGDLLLLGALGDEERIRRSRPGADGLDQLLASLMEAVWPHVDAGDDCGARHLSSVCDERVLDSSGRH